MQNQQTHFEQMMLPHLDAAYNLARWLTGNEQDADDMVQEAYLRALKSFGSFRGGDSRAWLLMIVRNTCYTWLQRSRASFTMELDEDIQEADGKNSEQLLLERVDFELLHRALDELPAEFREAIVLREMEGLPYKEIAQITHVPIGTVMSRLARARQRLQQRLEMLRSGELPHEM